MMTQSSLNQQQFHNMLQNFWSAISLDNSLGKYREKAWDHYLELGLPDRTTEVFRYVKLRNLYAKTFEIATSSFINNDEIDSFLFPESKDSTLVFINGFYTPELSRLKSIPSVVVLPLEEAVKTYGAFLNNHWAKTLKEETDSFAALNSAFHAKGVFIYIPPKKIIESPIQILNIIKSETPLLVHPRIQVFVGREAKVQFINEIQILDSQAHFINQVTDFAMEEASSAIYHQMSNNHPDSLWHFDATRALLKRDSHFKTIQVTEGSATTRYDYKACLIGENSEALLNGVWMLNNQRETHLHVLMDHQAPHCRSMQLFKGILNDVSSSSFEGKILVRQAAQKTEAFQLNNNLILNEGASADSKPNLEIFADDVKASHGATVGQLDEEQLFYLKTRGFSQKEAQNILVYGYSQEVIDQIQIPSVLDKVSKQAQEYVLRGKST